jgi:hypothetical protein
MGCACVFSNGMLETAIIFGALGVAAGFTWDYLFDRER